MIDFLEKRGRIKSHHKTTMRKEINMQEKFDTKSRFDGEIAANVVVESASGLQQFDLAALNLSRGRIFINEVITMKTAMRFTAAMAYLSDEEKPVTIYINSPGGDMYAGMLMYDVMKSYTSPMFVCCTGFAGSMAAVLLAAGQKGRRLIYPHSRVMIHEPRAEGNISGTAAEISYAANAALDAKCCMNELLAELTGKTFDEINEATSYDHYMNAQEAVSFGICDEIINSIV